jgi:hypothetical protein
MAWLSNISFLAAVRPAYFHIADLYYLRPDLTMVGGGVVLANYGRPWKFSVKGPLWLLGLCRIGHVVLVLEHILSQTWQASSPSASLYCARQVLRLQEATGGQTRG